MKKYFRVHDYSENIKAKVVIFSLKGKVDIWWEVLKNVKDTREKELISRRFEKYFWKKYLFENYYDKRAKKLYEHEWGKLTANEYTSRFLESLRYVPFIKDENTMIQMYLSGLP